MASSYIELNALLSPASNTTPAVRILGAPYAIHSLGLQRFVEGLQQVDEFAEEWPDLLRQLMHGLDDLRSAEADARLLALYSHYLVTVRSTAETGELLPQHMMTWLGKGPQRLPAENTVWFLLETEAIGSEAVRDVINVMGEEATFMGYFLAQKPIAETLEHCGIFLAMLLHLRQKWPDYYAWMQIDDRMKSIRELFLFGNEDLPIMAKGKNRKVAQELIAVYQVLSKTMYQTSFFVLLAEYARGLKETEGNITHEMQAILNRLMAD